MRVGPFRIRTEDELRAFVVGSASVVLLAVLHRRRRAWNVLTIWMLTAFGVLGLLALARHGQTLSETGDGAVLELYTLQATRLRLLLGPYSRFGWHHPGPLYLYLQVPWYVLSGYRTAGMQAGALLINAVAAGSIAWAIWRYATPQLAVALSVLGGFYLLRGREFVASPWNPHVTIVPTAAFIVLAAIVAVGRLSLLPWIAVFATFLIQTHVAIAPVVGAVGAVACAGALSSAREQHGQAASLMVSRAVSRAGWVLAALWLLPIAEELTRTPGNLTRLSRFFLVEQHGGQPLATAFPAWASSLSALYGSQLAVPVGLQLRSSVGWWPMLCALGLVGMTVAAMRIAFRQRRRFDGWLAALAVVAALTALWSTTRITETIFDHQVFWVSAVGMLNGAVILGALAAAAPTRAATDRVSRGGGVVALRCAIGVLMCAGIGINQMRRTQYDPGLARDDAAVQTLVNGVRIYVSEANLQRPLFRVHVSVWTTAAGALLQLYKTGVPFAVDENSVLVFGETLSANGREDVELVVAGRNEQPNLAARPGNRVIAQSGGVFVDALPLVANSIR